MTWEQGKWVLLTAYATFVLLDFTLYVMFWDWRERGWMRFLPWSGYLAALRCRRAPRETFRDGLASLWKLRVPLGSQGSRTARCKAVGMRGLWNRA